MKLIDARHTADLLEAASRGIRSRNQREKTDLTPKKVASWLMAIVLDLDSADDWSGPTTEEKL